MAVSPVSKRYTSAAYEDKYFPEKNAAIPFKWESTPGRTKDDDQQHADHITHLLNVAAEEDESEGNNNTEHHNKELSLPTIKTNNKEDDGSFSDTTPHALSIYPLPPPPKLTPTSPLRVKDLLQHGLALDSCLHHDDDDHHLCDHCPLHAYHHWFPWFSFRFWPFKASSVVPFHNSPYCIIKSQPLTNDPGLLKCQASPFVPGAPLQGRSQSFSHAQRSSGDGPMSASIGRALKPAPERRCNSFNSLTAPHHTILEHDEVYDSESSVATAAAAAMWAGACILAAAAADNHHHEINDPCKVARKLKDLMAQQSANFSEFGLPAPCCSTLPPAKKMTKSVEEEAFLKEGTQKSCRKGELATEVNELSKEGARAKVADEGFELQPINHKLVKRKGFFKLFKNECIACWCPSTY
ncbi:hypothetical protein GOP47_0014074 [Adiantum capillus-veneris]|uniref:Uncharacterized protein n=1 Tax=Adiantum capillus-veneris TaxID=13818 RepID=A0A9D4UR04_ADICA|nr:hypothetical protein GOP47_0014074 [Adiantum capillus-veneris]